MRVASFLFVASLLCAALGQESKNYTFAKCGKDKECEGDDLKCFLKFSRNGCVKEDREKDRCICAPNDSTSGYTYCKSDEDCRDRDEVCRRFAFYKPFCVAEKAISQHGKDLFVMPDADPIHAKCFNDESTGSGLAGDSCKTNAECSKEQACVTYSNSTAFTCCTGEQENCGCHPRQAKTCKSVSECRKDEVCLKGTVPPFCASEDPTNIFTGFMFAEDEPCVAIHHLEHLDSSDLVYGRPKWSNVLCDANDSCATPGHMVHYAGDKMMMKSYCELASCRKRVMKVNSPKYRFGRGIESNTEGLQFSAVAARFGTKLEEVALKTLLSLGA